MHWWRSSSGNQAERDLRPIKTQLKISGCHAAENGAKNWFVIRSYSVTALKHGLGALDAVRRAILARALDATPHNPVLIDITEDPGF